MSYMQVIEGIHARAFVIHYNKNARALINACVLPLEQANDWRQVFAGHLQEIKGAPGI